MRLRYSPDCGAVWARFDNGSAQGGKIWIENIAGQRHLVDLAGFNGESKYTYMLADNTQARACHQFFSDLTHTWVTNCTGWY